MKVLHLLSFGSATETSPLATATPMTTTTDDAIADADSAMVKTIKKYQNVLPKRNMEESSEDTQSELQRLKSNHSELLLHQDTLKKQLAFKNEQLRQFRAAVDQSTKFLAQPPQVESDVKMAE
ncbi:unnamed protein product [Phytophthora fragariaefolia]|uniref:Unnamed protein product n=1 Tax=Phytophthora fragariaefolia TaxID=1490495 RepID=A0A9W6XHB9_9STRA|nr:unnamed protein product [Phytophthora fragariaefolia]